MFITEFPGIAWACCGSDESFQFEKVSGVTNHHHCYPFPEDQHFQDEEKLGYQQVYPGLNPVELLPIFFSCTFTPLNIKLACEKFVSFLMLTLLFSWKYLLRPSCKHFKLWTWYTLIAFWLLHWHTNLLISSVSPQ